MKPGDQQLIELYAKMAAMTLPECRACRVPLSCCSREYCEGTLDHAKRAWGVVLPTTDHPTLPLMGPTGCTAAPHLRPACTLHTCDINSLGCKKNDLAWTERYFELRYAIDMAELDRNA